MAEKKDKPKEEEVKIPVFTVLKNGIILKNIFLNNPAFSPESQSSKDSSEIGKNPDQEEEKMLVGRHPDCHIVLDHPSISRFHLQVMSWPSSQRLAVIDLSSVHGTWVSGQKIEPQVSVEVADGDTVRLGASTRVYKLQWVPWSQAFEIEKRFVSPVAVPEEKEEIYQDENLISPMNKKHDSWRMEIPSAPPMPESMNSILPDVVPLDANIPTQRENLNLEDTAQSLFRVENKRLESRSGPGNISIHCTETLPAESVSSSMPVEVFLEADSQLERDNHSSEVHASGQVLLCDATENESPPIRRSEQQNMPSSIWSRRCKSVSVLRIQTGRTGEKMSEGIDAVTEVENQKESKDVEQCGREESLCKVLFEESVQSDKGTLNAETPVGLKSKKGNAEMMQMELQKLPYKGEEALSKVPFEESFLSDKENLTPITSVRRKSKKASHETKQMELQKSSLKGIAYLELEEDMFPSDKENLTPVTSVCRKSKKASLEMKQMKMQKSSLKGIAVLELEEDMFPSDKENLTPKFYRDLEVKKPTSKSHPTLKLDMMKGNVGRLPFQSLLENSIDKRKSDSVLHASSRNSASVSHNQIANGNNSTASASQSVDQSACNLGEGKRKWNMVVDTSSLLDEESRRSLKLLEGLKGTRLIIPRMVIRELDCLKRRGSRFRKGNEASSILQWIEECMVKTRWWIHVQSSIECVPIAPTPPASPRSRLSVGSIELPGSTINSLPFSTCGSLMEIVSPTAEDHVLECALLFKRIKDDGQLVLLTNDIALKIKAMAEGLICETATEFRESLVNPYSKRFMWVESTPVGRTWSSCFDDVGMKENYHHWPPATRKTAKAAEGAKGLKLILLHNSHYGLMNQVK